MAAHCQQTVCVLLIHLFFLSSLVFIEVHAKRTKDKIYIDMFSQNACFRLLNATHQIGCTSALEGNTGVVYYIQTDDDWNFVLRDGATPPYVAVLQSINFTRDIVLRLVHSGRVNGIAVISVNLTNDDHVNGISPDKSCPNDAYGLYHGQKQGNCKSVTWNPVGDGLMFQDLSIPIFSLTNQSDVKSIVTDCWEKFNKPINGVPRTYPLCATQLRAPMSAARDAETCIRRSNMVTNLSPIVFCDPLGDKNIVTTLKVVPGNETRPPKSVVLVGTRVDSMSMFQNEYPSADATVTGIVTMLATAKALWRLQEVISNQSDSKDVMFAFFQGEAFDYIGSSRMVYEMQKGRFPASFNENEGHLYLQKINLTHIAQFVELSQVGMRTDADSLWLHVDPAVRNKTQVQLDPMLQKLTDVGVDSNTTFQQSDPSYPLPPASLQRFLMEVGESPMPSFVVTDHKAAFTNKFYNSRYDLPNQIEATPPSMKDSMKEYDDNTTQSLRITGLATALARYLFWAATNSSITPSQLDLLQADIEDVNHMLYCFLHNPRCELFNFVISPDSAKALNKNKQPFPFYVTVSSGTNQVTSLIQRLLGHFTGQVVAKATKDSCAASGNDKKYSYLWMQGSISNATSTRKHVCYKTGVLLSKAESPAFDIPDYDWKSGNYSTWTESRWDLLKARVFLVPSKQFEVLTLTVGIGFLLVSLVAVYFISSSADVLFQNSANPEQSR